VRHDFYTHPGSLITRQVTVFLADYTTSELLLLFIQSSTSKILNLNCLPNLRCGLTPFLIQLRMVFYLRRDALQFF